MAMSRSLQIVLITVGCVLAYVTIRSLPAEKCEFLHYGEFVNDEGAIEGCGYEETGFFDMSEIRYPVIANLVPLVDPEPGVPTPFKLTLFTTTGRPVAWEDIAISHTERIHAMVVDPSLEDYHHVHPQPAGPAGHYLVEITPGRAGSYAVYLDFISLISSRRTLLETGFAVPGSPGAPSPDSRFHYTDADLRFHFEPLTGQLVTGQELAFRLEVEQAEGRPVEFSPVMDSFAHLVAFDEAGTGFAHLHPRNPFMEGQDPFNPDLEFAMEFDKPGYYRVWAQVIVNGRHLMVPFDLLVEAA